MNIFKLIIDARKKKRKAIDAVLDNYPLPSRIGNENELCKEYLSTNKIIKRAMPRLGHFLERWNFI